MFKLLVKTSLFCKICFSLSLLDSKKITWQYNTLHVFFVVVILRISILECNSYFAQNWNSLYTTKSPNPMKSITAIVVYRVIRIQSVDKIKCKIRQFSTYTRLVWMHSPEKKLFFKLDFEFCLYCYTQQLKTCNYYK